MAGKGNMMGVVMIGMLVMGLMAKPAVATYPCAENTPQLSVCVGLLGQLVLAKVALPSMFHSECFPLIQGIVNAQALVCLCSIKVEIKVLLNIYLSVDTDLALKLLDTCSIHPSYPIKCPN